MLATVMFAHGTPMLLGGDEFGRTQGGNNNPYCQDSELSWLDWTMAATTQGREMTDYVAKLIALRKEHSALRARHFLHGHREPAPGVHDIAWFDADGEPVPEDSWKNPERRLLGLRRVSREDDGAVSVLMLLLNPSGEDEIFDLPDPILPGRVLLDSARPNAPTRDLNERKLAVLARSAVLIHSKLERSVQ
jgi:glycogen operon protein